MEPHIKRSLRKCTALLLAVAAYFLVHEGAHLIYALWAGAFQEIRFLGPGIQVVTRREAMTDAQVGFLCILGPAAALTAGYCLLAAAHVLLRIRSVFLRAVGYYMTLALLLTDPLYLSVLYPYVGGGDMNGIKLLVPELYARVGFGGLAVVNMVIVFGYIVPGYRRAFVEFAGGCGKGRVY